MPQFYKQLNARDEFKKLIVGSIEAAKTNYNDLDYRKFFNAVEMFDSLMVSYKNDSDFIKATAALQNNNQSAQEQLKVLSLIDSQNVDSQQMLQKITFYRSYFTALVELATRTVFAGRDVDVDIKLEDVFKELGDFLQSASGAQPPVAPVAVLLNE